MKTSVLLRILPFFLLPGLVSSCIREKSTDNQLNTTASDGTALVITGAAARITQESALLESLYRSGELKHVVFISGASSGALNSVMLNAILSGKYSWERYHKLIESLSNEQVFLQEDRKIPVDTQPLRELLKRIVNDSLGFYTMSDLPVPTSFSVVSIRALHGIERTYRLSNIKINSESDPNLDIVDVLMASIAFPLAFPPVGIENSTTLPGGSYIDGGVGADQVPYRAVLEYEEFRKKPVSEMLVISRKSDAVPDLAEELELLGVQKGQLFDKLGISLEDITQEGFLLKYRTLIRDYPALAEKTRIYVPDFDRVFHMFDFNSLNEQYTVTMDWAQTHHPVPLKDYVDLMEAERIKPTEKIKEALAH